MEDYLASLKAVCPQLTEAELAMFASRTSVVELKRKAYFLEAGKTQRAIGFVLQGLVRSFYVDPAGNEITVGFYAEGDYATHYQAFIARQPSRYAIQCLEPAKLICLSYEDLQWLYGWSPNFERYGRLIAEEILKRQQARIESFIFQTAEQRYLDFIRRYPVLFNRISLSQLCSFLGIERQTLTRIRQKIARQ